MSYTLTVMEKNGLRCALATAKEVILSTPQDALDLLGSVRFNEKCDCIILEKSCVDEAFFKLSTGVAGEILQKFTNYYMRLAIVGDFSGYESRSLKDFIYESNKAGRIIFTASADEAMNRFLETQS